ncbi:hypothetical protein P692DRAFT_20831552, partial [Suillus brevipes Sb2]
MNRMPAGTYVCINREETGLTPSYLNIIIREICSVGSIVLISSHASLELSQEIRASFELDRTLDHRELIGELDLSFPPVPSVQPSLAL